MGTKKYKGRNLIKEHLFVYNENKRSFMRG